MLFRLMTRLANNLEHDVAEVEARAAAGADIRADLPRLGRRVRRAGRLVDFFGRRAS